MKIALSFAIGAAVSAAATLLTSATVAAASAVLSTQQYNHQQQQDQVRQLQQQKQHAQAMIDWVRSNGGFIHPSIEIRPVNGTTRGNTNSRNNNRNTLGLFVSHEISDNEVLMEIPRDCLLTGGPSAVAVGDRIEAAFPSDDEEGDDDNDNDDDDDDEFVILKGRVTAVYHKQSVSSRKKSSSLSSSSQSTYTYDLMFDNGKEFYNVKIGSFDPVQGSADCGTVRTLASHLQMQATTAAKDEKTKHNGTKVSENNKYHPYMNFLHNSAASIDDHPPAWSKQGQQLLKGLLGQSNLFDDDMSDDEQDEDDEDEDDNDEEVVSNRGIPPFDFTGWVEDDWIKNCNADPKDDVGIKAYFLVMQRASDEFMIPFFSDMELMHHRNNGFETKWLNTEYDSVQLLGEEEGVDDESFQVRSSRKIRAGEQLYTTYNLCLDCGNRHSGYGTPELFRDYGFVEDFPQRWTFHGHDIAFDLDEITSDSSSSTKTKTTTTSDDCTIAKQFQVKWIDDELPTKKKRDWMQNQLDRLAHLKMTYFCGDFQHNYYPDLPQHEWDSIVEYHNALMLALVQAIHYGTTGSRSTITTTNASSSISSNGVANVLMLLDGNSTCKSSPPPGFMKQRTNSLKLLRAEPEEWPDHRPYTCNWHDSFHYDFWKTLEIVESPYQTIGFHYNPILKDTCFDLDDTTQICSSYRPMYHEMTVHYTARYLEKVERVVFVGGGDSMLLHDVLQYPSLQLVVGLELDQQVTRGSFKYFGTSPHFDDERVEWWFGDATKSLLMLPKDYFGSFDMVLVDLSETVMALTVTEHLDVMEALTLLMKPNGIVVKNEYAYFKEMSRLFKNTIHIHYYDVPLVCSQSLILGSNKIDFLRGDVRDHGVEYLYDLLDSVHEGNTLIRDLEKNETSSQKHCNKITKDDESSDKRDRPESQEKSPGILMIVEAEKATAQPRSSKEVVELVRKALVKEGLSFVSSVELQEDNAQPKVAIILREGYVVARFWPQYRYFAFDVHLWSNFDQHDNIKRSLIEGVGSTVNGPSSSSFRIVAGGMFGVSTWKNDEQKRGPQVTKLCDDDDVAGRSNTVVGNHLLVDSNHVMLVLEESLKLVTQHESRHDGKSQGIVAAVICGPKGQECQSDKNLRTNHEISEVLTLWDCPRLDEGKSSYGEMLLDCEKETIATLESFVLKEKPIRAIILDSSAKLETGQILYKIFRNSFNAKRLLDDDVFVSAILLDQQESWRRVFVQKFREEIAPDEPSFSSEIQFNSSIASLELCLMSSGDVAFVENVRAAIERLENATGLTADVRSIRAGLFDFVEILKPTKVFMPNDFDQTSQLEQWFSQRPLGLQTIFQIENKKQEEILSSSSIKSALEKTLVKRLSSEYELHEEKDIADGSILVALWNGGSVVAIWDGRNHIDINLFTYEEDKKLANKLVAQFEAYFEGLKVVLRDEQPRGIGRVINLSSDIISKEVPFWAKDFETYDAGVNNDNEEDEDEDESDDEEEDDSDDEENDVDEDEDDEEENEALFEARVHVGVRGPEEATSLF